MDKIQETKIRMLVAHRLLYDEMATYIALIEEEQKSNWCQNCKKEDKKYWKEKANKQI